MLLTPTSDHLSTAYIYTYGEQPQNLLPCPRMGLSCWVHPSWIRYTGPLQTAAKAKQSQSNGNRFSHPLRQVQFQGDFGQVYESKNWTVGTIFADIWIRRCL